MEWKKFPEYDEFRRLFDSISRERPYETLLVGGYRGTMQVGEREHPYWVYYPEGMEYSCKNLVLLIPNGETVDEFLERTGWRSVAEEDHLLLLMAGSSEDIWTGEEEAAARLAALDKERNDRKYMDNQRAYTYFAGYGEGAEWGHRYVAANPAVYASAAFFGPISTAEEFLAARGEEGTAAGDIRKKKVPCPVCFVGKEEVPDHILSYWKRANQVEAVPYQQGNKTVWLPDQRALESTLEHQPVARVQCQREGDVEKKGVAADVYRNFLLRTVRATGILNGDLHPYRTPEEWGVTRREILVDGWRRHWYEYVPERTQVLTDGKIPVVVFLHGGSSSALSNLYSHEWVQVAKERGFILAMPTGMMRFQETILPHPAWNASRVQDHMDDEKFIRKMLQDLEERFPIDRGRVYVNGHSMGSAMTQRCALAMPELFAAVCSNSGVVTGGFMGDFDSPGVREDIPIPVWIQMGEKDVGGGTLENNPKAARTVAYWANRYHLPDFERPSQWRSGRYLNREWRTREGVPMLRYTTTLEKPHAITPQDPWLYYDGFFSHWSRDEEGCLYYQGKKVI